MRISHSLHFCLVAVGLMACTLQASAQPQDSLVAPAYLVAGHYYTKALSLDVLPMTAVKGISRLTAEGVTVIKVELADGTVLPAEWAQCEIPHPRVRSLAALEESDATYRKMSELTSAHADKNALARGAALGDFQLKDIDGNIWNRQSFLGHIVVVNLWYSGCGPCLREMPELSGWKARYPNVLFFSACFEKADKVRRIITQRSFNWTHLVEDRYFVKWIGRQGYPVTLVIDPQGMVQAVVAGANAEAHQQILAAIDRLQKG